MGAPHLAAESEIKAVSNLWRPKVGMCWRDCGFDIESENSPTLARVKVVSMQAVLLCGQMWGTVLTADC